MSYLDDLKQLERERTAESYGHRSKVLEIASRANGAHRAADEAWERKIAPYRGYLLKDGPPVRVEPEVV